MRARLALYSFCQASQGREDDLPPSPFKELDRSTDLGAHASLRKLARRKVGADLGQAHASQLALIGLPKVDRDAFDAGGEAQQRRLEAGRQVRGREVLVDDGLWAAIRAPLEFGRRDA